MPAEAAPLDGILVVDATRMLPGAVAARALIDQGARLIKIEAPRGGDMMRGAGPGRGGVSAGFAHYFRGAESLPLDLRDPRDQQRLRRLLRRADVFLESFRPGTLAGWGLDPTELRAANPALVTCAMPGYPASSGTPSATIGHDLNFVAQSGLLSLLGGRDLPAPPAPTIPAVQFADITAGLLTSAAVVSALLLRTRTGRGTAIEQPLATGPLQFTAWAMADTDLAGPDHPGASKTLLAGRVPSYRCYATRDGRYLAVGCLEPKFWIEFTRCLELPELAVLGLDPGPRGEAAAAAVAERLAEADAQVWLDRLAPTGLPVSLVQTISEALESQGRLAPLLESTPLPDGSIARGPGPAIPSLGRTPERAAPRLGEHAEALSREFGLDAEDDREDPG